jgi:hypothetical protein
MLFMVLLLCPPGPVVPVDTSCAGARYRSAADSVSRWYRGGSTQEGRDP